MFRYLSVVWNTKDPIQADAYSVISAAIARHVPTMKPVFRTNGVCVFCHQTGTPGCTVHLLEAGVGVVLGSLFGRHADIQDPTPNLHAALDRESSLEVSKSKGKSLLSKYWGNYVALLTDPSASTTRVIKDPVGTLPCFATTWRNIVIIFSCLTDCLALRLLPLTVNWSYVALRVGSAGFCQTLNPLNEVTEIHRGECLEISTEGSRPQLSTALYWRPTTFAESALAILDPTAARQALWATVRSATHTLAQDHRRVMVRLSGGLDSSIVLGVLKDAGQNTDVKSYTYYIRNGRSDERRWARLAASHAGREHFEFEMQHSEFDLEPLARTEPSVSPAWNFGYLAVAEIEGTLGKKYDYSALFTGDGGDSSFGAIATRFAVDDFIRLNGLTRGTLRLASRVALRTNSLAWATLAAGLRRSFVGQSMRDFRNKLLVGSAFANPKVHGLGLDTRTYPHPWFAMCRDVPWHVINRLGSLLDTPQFYNPFLHPDAHHPAIVSPLYSQPVVELSLRIPVYLLFHNGWERGLAREAFAREVPVPILRRQWKDRAPGAFEQLVQRNRAFMHGMLVDGMLCQHGLLEREAVSAALSGKLSTKQFHVGELMNHLHLELWVRGLVNTSSRALVA